MATATDDWRWGLRVTPIMGAVAVLLIIFLLVDPERGAADGSRLKPTSPISDLKALLRNIVKYIKHAATLVVPFSKQELPCSLLLLVS